MSGPPSGDEIARHYLTSRDRIIALVSGLDDEAAATAVPATPGWTVHDVLAHLVAIPADALAGRLQGVPTEEFTSEQVTSRKDRTIDELLAEWEPTAVQIAEGARAGLVPPNLAVDALTHEQDMRGALGRPPAISAEELRFCTQRYAFGCGYGLKHAGVAPLLVAASDTEFTMVAGIGEPAASVRAPEFELFRAFPGRRSRRQVESFDWTGDVGAYLDRFNIFGPLPEVDVVDA